MPAWILLILIVLVVLVVLHMVWGFLRFCGIVCFAEGELEDWHAILRTELFLWLIISLRHRREERRKRQRLIQDIGHA